LILFIQSKKESSQLTAKYVVTNSISHTERLKSRTLFENFNHILTIIDTQQTYFEECSEYDLMILVASKEDEQDISRQIQQFRKNSKTIKPILYMHKSTDSSHLERMLSLGVTHLCSMNTLEIEKRNLIQNFIRSIFRRHERDIFRQEALILNQNITEIGKQYRKESEDLQNKLKVKETWFASMVHELRTPINGVIGISHLLKDTKLDEKQKDYLDKLHSSSQILLGLVNDLLDLSKIEAGKMQIETIEFNINDMLTDVANVIRPKTREKGLALIYDISNDVPELMQGDPLRVSQILINLMGNAVKFTSSGEIVLKISISNSSENSNIIFEVIDSGIGIPKDKIDTLFDTFTQTDKSTSRKYGGTGLGLNISKQLTELMGGTISVESEVGKGSKFRVSLPLDIQERRHYRLPSADLMHLRVLVVDSNTKSSTALIRMLKYFHFETHSTTNTEDLNVALLNENYDLILVESKFWNSSIQKSLHAKIIIIGEDIGEEIGNRDMISMYLERPFTQQTIFNSIVNLYADTKAAKLQKKSDILKEKLTQIGKKRILVAEDNVINQAVLMGLLEDTHLQVMMSSNGKEAIEMLNSYKDIKLILMDINMPVMDGFEATKNIKQDMRFSHIPIIAMTANPMTSQEILQAKMQGYLAKPVDVEAFYNTLITYLSNDVNTNNKRVIKTQNSDNITKNICIPKHKENRDIFSGFDMQSGLEKCNSNKELYIRVISDFVEFFHSSVGKIRYNIQIKDYDSAKSATHYLYNSASNIGAVEISKVAQSIENNLARKNKNQKILNELTDRLDKLFEQNRVELQNSGYFENSQNGEYSFDSLDIETLIRFEESMNELLISATRRRPLECKRVFETLNKQMWPMHYKSIINELYTLSKQYRYKEMIAIIGDIV